MVSGIGATSAAFGAQDMAALREKMFQKADADGDGVISKAEFGKLGPPPGPPPGGGPQGMGPPPSADEIFQLADEDGDGAISQDDLASALEKLMEKHKNDGQPPTGYAADGAATYDAAAAMYLSTTA